MEFSKRYPLNVPIRHMIASLQRPQTLQKALPGSATVRHVSGREVEFSSEKTIALLRIKLRGTVEYTPSPDGTGLVMLAKAGNLLTGKFLMRIEALGRSDTQDVVDLAVSASGTGAVGKLLKEHEATAVTRLDQTFQRFLHSLSA